MQSFIFNRLKFNIVGDKISLRGLGVYAPDDAVLKGNFAEFQVAGENRPSRYGNKQICSSEGARLKYVSHSIRGDVLTVIQKSELLEVKTVISAHVGTSVLSVYSVAENVSGGALTLTEAAAFCLPYVADVSEKTAENLSFFRFEQGHHTECRVHEASFAQSGIATCEPDGQRALGFTNVGSWSTKEELPQGIIKSPDGALSFQIESDASWRYEISDGGDGYYLLVGGQSECYTGWSVNLAHGESYTTEIVALCREKTVGDAIAQMSAYRRIICGKCEADRDMPVIFNEYMHYSWDSPTEENTAYNAPIVADVGADYYVIDCGWHDEVPGNEIYPYVGEWKESKTRFPHGVRRITDYIRSLGMRAGLWIEPEVVGERCYKMLDYYGDECFVKRYGKKVCVNGRYFLDFRKQKVVDYLSETIRRMVEDYGADYVKLDYNQDMGVGTEVDAASFGDGLKKCRDAYAAWVDGIRRRFPNVIFETCSSGGLRMDYKTLRRFSLVSTSDQTDYLKYRAIAANVLACVLPEQAAVWNYPVDCKVPPNVEFVPSKDWVKENVSEEQIVTNVVNSLLGRMHLASRIGLLGEKETELLKEGVAYYKKITRDRAEGIPFLPVGFANDEKGFYAAGFKTGDKAYLAVWNVGGAKSVTVPIREYKNATCGYPRSLATDYLVNDGNLHVDFTEDEQSRFFELF